MGNSNLTAVSIPKALLPEGLSIRIDQKARTFAWKHNAEVGSGDATLGGLRSLSDAKPNAEPKLATIPAKSLGVITDEKAKTISQNYMNLPEILREKFGVAGLDEKREQFIKNAAYVKAKLAQSYGSNPIPAKVMKQADDVVNKHSFKCVELEVVGFSVSKNNVKGSHLRKSDGMYVVKRTLRRYCIDRPLSDKELQQLLELICGSLVRQMTRAAEFRVSQRGTDAHGHPLVQIALMDYRDPRSTKAKPK